jgi:ABC-type amino acid transport substrate-binding protein
MGVPRKERLLGPLEVVMTAIERVTGFVVRLAPYGVVPIVAVAAGTLSLARLERLQVYLVAFVVAALLLGVVLLPLLVASLTPFGVREILHASRFALLTAFLTSSVFVVLPLLAQEAKVLARRHGIDDGDGERAPDMLVPVAFNLPTAGKLLTLLFVPFAAWLSGDALRAAAYPRLLVAGLLSYFAKAQVALPFLLDVAGVPHDVFQLYIPSAVLTGKFDSAVGAMSLLALTLLAVAATAGRAEFSLARLARFAGTAAVLLAVVVFGTRLLLATAVDTRYTRDQEVRRMHLSRGEVPALLDGDSVRHALEPGAGPSTLARIRTRGVLRMGFLPGRMPFAFVNADGQAVGLDVELARTLADDLGVRLEMVRLTMDQVEPFLAAGVVDLVPSIPDTHHWLGRVRLSQPYLDVTVGLIVLDGRREEFGTLERLRAHDSLRIGLVAEPDLYENYVQAMAGPVPYRLVQLPPDPDAVLGTRRTDLDAVMLLAEIGTAWTLLHPAYSVVVPQPLVIRRPLGYASALSAQELGATIDAWVRLQHSRGNLTRAFDYWVLGKGAESPGRRWSVAEDVLGWFRE